MGDYKKIFLIVDPKRGETPAFQRALQLARTTGAHLHLALFDGPGLRPLGHIDDTVAERVRMAFRHQREAWLDKLARKLTAEGVFTSSEVDLRTPEQEIIAERVLEAAPDLVIKDVEHQPALSRILFTPLDWHLVRLCPAPLLFVNSAATSAPRRVVVAVDTANVLEDEAGLNDRIVREALRFALQFDAEAHLVHSVPPFLLEAGVPMEGIEGIAAAWDLLARQDRERFDEFVRRHGVPPERCHLLAGPPTTTVATFANETSADVLVIGTTYRTRFDRLLVGSTAEAVLNRAHCDVLVVQPEGFKAAVGRHLGLAPHPARQVA